MLVSSLVKAYVPVAKGNQLLKNKLKDPTELKEPEQRYRMRGELEEPEDG